MRTGLEYIPRRHTGTPDQNKLERRCIQDYHIHTLVLMFELILLLTTGVTSHPSSSEWSGQLKSWLHRTARVTHPPERPHVNSYRGHPLFQLLLSRDPPSPAPTKYPSASNLRFALRMESKFVPQIPPVKSNLNIKLTKKVLSDF